MSIMSDIGCKKTYCADKGCGEGIIAESTSKDVALGILGNGDGIIYIRDYAPDGNRLPDGEYLIVGFYIVINGVIVEEHNNG